MDETKNEIKSAIVKYFKSCDDEKKIDRDDSETLLLDIIAEATENKVLFSR